MSEKSGTPLAHTVEQKFNREKLPGHGLNKVCLDDPKKGR
jgi:hypothetical protein